MGEVYARTPPPAGHRVQGVVRVLGGKDSFFGWITMHHTMRLPYIVVLNHMYMTYIVLPYPISPMLNHLQGTIYTLFE